MASTLAIPIRPAGSAERYFQWSLYLLLVTGFAALAGTGKLDFLSLAVVTPALVVRGYHLIKKKTLVLSERWTNYLTIVYFLVYILDYLMLSQGFVSATVHLVLFIMVVKIFSVQRDRDLLYLAILSFLMVLAAAVLTVDTLFLLTFGFFLLTAMSTFISMEMRRSERAAQSVGIAAQQERRFNRSLSGVAVLLAFATLAGGTVLFFILPRMSTGGGYLRNFGFQSSFATGFSSEVQLGGIGQIQQSNSVVMHVQVLRGKLPPDPKWRGVALVNFDGRRWWNTPDEPTLSLPMANTGIDLSRFRVKTAPMFSAVATPRTTTLSYRVVMEPIGSYIFFVAPAPVKLSGSYDQVSISQEGSLFFFSEAGKTVGVYYGEADTRDPQPLIQDSNSRDYPPGLELMYLQIPKTLDPRIAVLAKEITASATSNYARVHALELYLRKNFGYTLELPGLKETDPIANFLFDRKKGHCEYFASAMAVMVRTLGIPARVVNGFRGGEFNDLNNSYILRSKDAHSWVEVYFPDYGWATFDPTPAAGADGAQTASWARFGLYLDVLRETWREWVVNYDFTHQLKLSYELSSRASNVQGETRWWFWRKYRKVLKGARNFQGSIRDISTQSVVMIGVLLLLIVLLPFAPRAYRSLQYTRMRKDPQRAPKHVASFWYTRMVKLMEGKGVHKSPNQTPSEFAATIRDPLIRKEIALFTDHYQRARFDESTQDAQLLPGLYQALMGKGR